ncbi:MAG TPA: cupin domain-containing protein [Vicinamibacterales bacterium]|jgi:mannose-6-phosphate isomerase-like protein (cupin superfamily)|nr:cupin domain-containing protein [Vicinamibacterales bacterium]
MKRAFGILIAAAVVSVAALNAQAPAQSPAQGRGGAANPLPPVDQNAVSQVTVDNFREQMVDPGVFYAVIMDRPEVRIGHTRLAPGGARRTHTHDDVTWHLLIPVSGTLTMTVGNDPPIETVPGKAYFMKVGTPHSFTNKGTVDALSIEVFVKPAPKANAGLAAPRTEAEALAFAMTALTGAPH